MLLPIYRQFSQGIYVATAALTSILTLGYMTDDIHRIEKKQLRMKYEEQISQLNSEMEMLKYKNVELNNNCK